MGCEDANRNGDDGGGPSSSAFASRKLAQRTQRMRAVKCCLKKRLGHPAMMDLIDDLVVYTTHCCRSWSLVFNKLLLESLWATNDVPAWLRMGDTMHMREVLLGCALRTGNLLPRLQPTFDRVGTSLHVAPRPSMRQALFFAADAYTTNLHNGLEDRLYKMVSRLFKAAFRACNVPHRKEDAEDWAVHVLRGDEEPPESERTRVARTVTRNLFTGAQDAVFAEKSFFLHLDVDGRRRNDPVHTELIFHSARWWQKAACMGAGDQIRAAWLVLREGARWGMKGFSLAPIHTMQRKHVRIDAELFKKYFWPELVKLKAFTKPERAKKGEESQQGAAREAAFKQCFKLKGLMSHEATKRWKPTGSFMTDGYSLAVMFISEVQTKKEAAKKPELVREPGQEFVGADPGEVNVVTLAGFDGRGAPWVRTLSRFDLRQKSGELGSIQQARRENASIRPILDRMSLHACRTGYPDQLQGYIDACSGELRMLDWTHCEEGMPPEEVLFCADVKARLEQVIGGKKPVRRRMANYLRRRSCIDSFLSGLPVRDPSKVVLAYGAAKWKHLTGPCTPTTAIFKACARTFGHVELTDEYRTTISNFWTGEVCSAPMLGVESPVGERTWQESRGLKCSKSIDMLGLLQSGKLHRGAVVMTEHGTGAPVATFSRDGNAALNIRECVARTKRPGRLCRSAAKKRAEQQRVRLVPRVV